eukprot:TRINITY_DN8722_c0_g1_i1.p1 TRINITY_DN8722_c0_g1~~TRINITY_DN8722_c0_g1_i1.p1  ORF type:complete len:100 (-),score=0.29 TRINITY_DN8722_c0_g1_i1:176-475(-)
MTVFFSFFVLSLPLPFPMKEAYVEGREESHERERPPARGRRVRGARSVHTHSNACGHEMGDKQPPQTPRLHTPDCYLRLFDDETLITDKPTTNPRTAWP